MTERARVGAGKAGYVLLATAAILVAAAIFYGKAIIDRQSEIKDALRLNSTWPTAQAIGELYRFEQELTKLRYREPGGHPQQLRLWLDILKGRVDVLRNQKGPYRQFIEGHPEQAAVVDRFAEMVDGFDVAIQNSEDPAVLDRMRAQSQAMVRELPRLNSQANRFTVTLVFELQDRLGELFAIFFVVSGLAMLALLATGYFFYRQSRDLVTVQHQLAGETARARNAERLLREAVNTAPDGFIVYDENDKIVLRNDAIEAVYRDFAPAIQEGNAFRDIVDHGLRTGLYSEVGDDPESHEKFIRDRLNIHREGDAEYMYHGPDDRWVRVRERKSESGFIVSVATELTHMKHTELALVASQERYRGIIEDQNEFIIRFDRDLITTFANRSYAEHAGKPRKELIGTPMTDIMTPEDVPRFKEKLKTLTRENPSHEDEVRVVHEDGSESWEAWTDRAIFDAEGNLAEYQAIGRDITKEKQAALALETATRQFRDIAEAHPVPVILVRLDDQSIVYASTASVPLLGPDLETLRGRNASSLFARPAQLAEFVNILNTHGKADLFNAEVRNADGSTFKAELTARQTEYDGQPVVAVSLVDTTERERAQEEIARQRQALAQGEKLTALGALLASVSHELNNPLSIIVGQSQLLEASAEDEKTLSRANKIATAAKRSARIVKTFLSMVRQRPPSRASVSLNDSIESALEVAAYGLKTSGIELTLDLDQQLPTISADADQLVQVIVNLLINAQQALAEQEQPRELNVRTERSSETMVRLVVADNGPGVASDMRERIFDPFFTTKPEGLGTGIGLSVCANIIRSHGGAISVVDAPGGGAAFTVDLPISETTGVAAETETELSPLIETATQGSILVVDDEADIADTLRDILEIDGHSVETAQSGFEALDKLSEKTFDLIISDLRMPEMDGPSLYGEIEKGDHHPLDRIVFITGDSLSANIRAFLNKVQRPFIEKPLQPKDVRRLVGQMLQPASESPPSGGPPRSVD